MQNQVVVLDIGSSKVTALIGERGVNKTFLIKGFSEREYSGFTDGQFLDVQSFSGAVKAAIREVREITRVKIAKVYVGVPGEFTTVITKNHHIAFSKKKKIRERDLDELFDVAFPFKGESYRIINRSAVWYELDDYRKMADPIGCVSEVLKGSLSYVLCDTGFINTLSPILEEGGVREVEYVSSALAEVLYLFEAEQRDRICVLLDIGYITASFSVVKGDGIIYQKSFAYGGGYITGLLSEILGVEPDIAEKLKRKINLTCGENGDNYNVIDGDNEYNFSVKNVNDIDVYSLDELCESISACLADAKISIPEYVPISVTGGGVSYIRGAKEHLSNRLNMLVEVVAPKLPHLNKPIESSYIALLDLALTQAPQKEGLFQKLFN